MTAGIDTLNSSNSKPHASLWPYDGPMMAPKVFGNLGVYAVEPASATHLTSALLRTACPHFSGLGINA